MERLFIAIRITEAPMLLDLVRNTRILMRRERMRWIPDMNLHITLKFLGKVNEDKEPAIKEAIQKAVDEFDDFSLNFKGLGNFGSRVLWAGVEFNAELNFLQERIEDNLTSLFKKEEKDFVPHITLSRISHLANKTQFFKIIDANRNRMLDNMHVTEVCLMKSELKPAGAVYSIVERFPLHVHEELVLAKKS